ncbi:MAG: hypothetical protein ACREIV_11900 [Planctomycetaceae bacterium]
MKSTMTSVTAEIRRDVSGPALEVVRGVASAERRVRADGRPTHSIVIASREARRELEAHLHFLMGSAEAATAEVVVARAGEPTEMRSLRASYPQVRFVALPKETSAAELRAAGMVEASGDIVTLLDDVALHTHGTLARIAGRSDMVAVERREYSAS